MLSHDSREFCQSTRGVWLLSMRCGQATSLCGTPKIDLIALGQTIEGSTIDPEELRCELFVAFGLFQHTVDVALHPGPKAR